MAASKSARAVVLLEVFILRIDWVQTKRFENTLFPGSHDGFFRCRQVVIAANVQQSVDNVKQ
jgi:hypothetical protein